MYKFPQAQSANIRSQFYGAVFVRSFGCGFAPCALNLTNNPYKESP